MDLFPIEENLAFIGNQGASEGLDQGGLAGAIVADHGQDLAGVEIEVCPVQGNDMAVVLHKATRLQDWFWLHAAHDCPLCVY